jgi:hypothetical protein
MARKTWKHLNRERIAAARCTIERLVRRLGMRQRARQGV